MYLQNRPARGGLLFSHCNDALVVWIYSASNIF